VNYFQQSDVKSVENVGKLTGWIGGNAHQVDPNAADEKFHTSPPILLKGEKVLMAFKVGRDLDLYTTHRFLAIDVKGMTGKKVEYYSFPWRFACGFSVQTAGSLDFDSEVFVHFDIPGRSFKKQELKKKKVDLFAAQRVLVAKVCGLE